ncbi:unnamed protein product, partial [Mesorhabditis spiculigera]
MSQIEVDHDGNEHQAKFWDWPLHGGDGVIRVHDDGTGFEVGLDAKYFTEKEITVKVIGDRLEIDFEHEQRTDKFGSITRKISRCYHLPAGVDAGSIKSHLSQGILYIRGNKQ